jgi:hypothetical protein
LGKKCYKIYWEIMGSSGKKMLQNILGKYGQFRGKNVIKYIGKLWAVLGKKCYRINWENMGSSGKTML